MAGSLQGSAGLDGDVASNLPGGSDAGSGGSANASAGAAGAVGAAGSMEGNPDVDFDGAGGTEADPDVEADPCDNDQDFDGVGDCVDECPQDAFKSEPGVCGCGAGDTDIDFDGTFDCVDECELDGGKTEPGICGCGQADVDSDEDGLLDCNEGCPFDPELTEPGACGCGAPADLALCLRHRYSFEGEGEIAVDSIGGADGTIFNTALTDTGNLVLAGTDTDQYVELPAGIVSTLGPSVTIEVWLTWTGAGGPWQRIFDFGNSELAAGQQGAGVTYLFVTPANTINLHLRAAFTVAGPGAERAANAPTALAFNVGTHVALVVDGPGQTLSLYQDGVLVDTQPTLDTTLAGMNDVNNWIGRSQFIADEELQGSIEEFRIYGSARSAEQIAAQVAAGPDALPEE
jgi:hypothetical protein